MKRINDDVNKVSLESLQHDAVSASTQQKKLIRTLLTKLFDAMQAFSNVEGISVADSTRIYNSAADTWVAEVNFGPPHNGTGLSKVKSKQIAANKMVWE